MIEEHIYDLKWGVINKWDLQRAVLDLDLDSISLNQRWYFASSFQN